MTTMTTQPITGGSPVLIQSRFGTQGNFELVTAHGGGLAHFWRNNDDPPVDPWSLPTRFGGEGEPPGFLFGKPTMIESNFGSPGNLEVICVGEAPTPPDNLYYFWRDSGPMFTWNGPYALPITPPPPGVGNPVLIQSRFGVRGNFELVTSAPAGGLAHYWRNNDDANHPWSAPTPFGGELGDVWGISMIQSNFGDPGNLEVICEAGGQGTTQLYHFWRDSGPTFTWNGPYPLPITLPGRVTGPPALIQSRFGTQGNFELLIPWTGGLAHCWRNNDDPNHPWSEPSLFAGELVEVAAPTMIQSNFGDPGNLEVICEAGGLGAARLYYFWRDSGPTFTWNGPYPLVSAT
jgi:hypothetical protein